MKTRVLYGICSVLNHCNIISVGHNSGYKINYHPFYPLRSCPNIENNVCVYHNCLSDTEPDWIFFKYLKVVHGNYTRFSFFCAKCKKNVKPCLMETIYHLLCYLYYVSHISAHISIKESCFQ